MCDYTNHNPLLSWEPKVSCRNGIVHLHGQATTPCPRCNTAALLRATLAHIREAQRTGLDIDASAGVWEYQVTTALAENPAVALDTLVEIGPQEFHDYPELDDGTVQLDTLVARQWPWPLAGVSAHIQVRLMAIR